MLARRMTLGPWLLLGRLSSADPGVMQWRACRTVEDPARPNEVALLVPHEWRPRADLAAALAAAAAPAFELTHPTHARLLEVGVTDEGTPWLATELVEGYPIDQWVRVQGLEVHKRRALLEQAAQGAAFAHARKMCHGRIHPGQIVVLPGDQVRWLNFGLRAILAALDAQSDAEADATVHATADAEADTEARGGTPSGVASPAAAYAAPELARPTGGATEAGDIYSLGVVALEVLAGASPWHGAPANGALPTGAAPAARERPDPWPRPSELAATAGLRRELREGFDAIVARATMAAPAERYASMGELTDDLRRAAARLPLVAVDGGLVYRFGRLARRHPWLLAAAGGVALVFVGTFALVGLMAWNSARELERTEAARRASEAVAQVLLRTWQAEANDTTGANDTTQGATAGREARTAATQLGNAERLARASLAEQPASLAAALATLAREHAQRGAFAEARKLLAEALPQLATTDEQAQATCDDAWAQARLGEKPAQAEARLRSAIGTPRLRPITRAQCLARLADLEGLQDRRPDARQTLRQARQQWERSPERPAELALRLGHAAAPLSAALGKFREAQEWVRWTLPPVAALQRDKSAVGIEMRGLLVELTLTAGDAQQALQLADDHLVLVAGSAFPAAAEPATAPPTSMLIAAAEPRLELQRLDEARERLERALALATARGEAVTQKQARCLMARAALRERDTATAARWLKTVPEPTGADTGATPHAAAGALPGSEAPRDPAREAERAAQREVAWMCQAVQTELALQVGRPIEAQREADRLLSAARDTPSRSVVAAMLLRTQALLSARQDDRALSAALLTLQMARALQDEDDSKARPSFRSGQAALVLAEAYQSTGDTENARKAIELAQQQLGATLPDSHPWRQRVALVRTTLVAAVPK